MPNEEIKIKYLEMVDDFKSQCLQMLDQSVGTFDEIMASAHTNFENVKQSYTKGAMDMKNEVIKGNLSMVESFRKNCKIVQQNIDESYNFLKGDNMAVFTANISKFREQFEAAVKKSPVLTSSKYNEVVNHLLSKQQQALDASQTKYKAIAKHLQDSYEDSARKLTMTMKDLTPPPS